MTPEAASWVVGLPWVDPPLSLNRHLLRHHEARLAGEVRTDTCRLVRAARIPRQERVRVTMHWQPKTDRTRDVENPVATLKPVCDGIVDAGVVDDDDPPRMVKDMPVIHAPVKGRRPHMWLVIEALPAVEGAPPARTQPKPKPPKKPGGRGQSQPSGRVADLGEVAAQAGRGRRAPRVVDPIPGGRRSAPAGSDWAARVAAARRPGGG